MVNDILECQWERKYYKNLVSNDLLRQIFKNVLCIHGSILSQSPAEVHMSSSRGHSIPDYCDFLTNYIPHNPLPRLIIPFLFPPVVCYLLSLCLYKPCSLSHSLLSLVLCHTVVLCSLVLLPCIMVLNFAWFPGFSVCLSFLPCLDWLLCVLPHACLWTTVYP